MNTDILEQVIQQKKEAARARVEAIKLQQAPQVAKADSYMVATYGEKHPVGVPLKVQIKYWL